MSSKTAGSFAAGVSRALTKQGLRPLPSGTPITREGVRVGRFSDTRASVRVDIDAPVRAKRTADDIAEALAAAGYAVERRTDTTMYVERAEA